MSITYLRIVNYTYAFSKWSIIFKYYLFIDSIILVPLTVIYASLLSHELHLNIEFLSLI